LLLLGRGAVLLAGVVLVAGCGSTTQPTDELQIVATPVAATAAESPPPSTTPSGTVLPLTGEITAMVADPRTRTLAVAIAQPPSVALFGLDNLTPVTTVPVAGKPEALAIHPEDGSLLVAVPTPGQLVRVALPAGTATVIPVNGAPTSVSGYGPATLVATRDTKSVAVVDDGRDQRSISGQLFSADGVFTVGDRAVVLDRVRTALFDLDVNAGTVGVGLRAGQGATNAVVDRFGRVLVTDTRGGALLAFSVNPVLLRQRYPVPGAPYGIAYDPNRDLAWVTLTERNEVVGYDVTGGEPTQRFRFPTVRQPNSVTVDPNSGRVFVASANGGGIQVTGS
jgi:hypothetical protein